MKSVGEVMAIGSNFQESLQKAIRGLEIGRYGLNSLLKHADKAVYAVICESLRLIVYGMIADAFRQGLSLDDIIRKVKLILGFWDKFTN